MTGARSIDSVYEESNEKSCSRIEYNFDRISYQNTTKQSTLKISADYLGRGSGFRRESHQFKIHRNLKFEES